MEKKFHINITGFGTREQIIDTLKTLIDNIEVSDDNDIPDEFQRYKLLIAISELKESTTMNWDYDKD